MLPLLLVAFCCGFVVATKKEDQSHLLFHDTIVNHPHQLTSLITPRNSSIGLLAKELRSPENAFLFLRDRIDNDPSMPAVPAGEILNTQRASCLGKAIYCAASIGQWACLASAVRIVTGEVESNGIIDHRRLKFETKRPASSRIPPTSSAPLPSLSSMACSYLAEPSFVGKPMYSMIRALPSFLDIIY